MILVDANLLIYAKVEDFTQHAPAKAWLDARLNGSAGVGLSWASLTAFARIVSNPRVFNEPMKPTEAWEQVEQWRARRVVFTPEPTERHADILGRLVRGPAHQANLLPDAHLAALALDYGLTLCSTDGDFARFDGLTWVNPLA